MRYSELIFDVLLLFRRKLLLLLKVFKELFFFIALFLKAVSEVEYDMSILLNFFLVFLFFIIIQISFYEFDLNFIFIFK